MMMIQRFAQPVALRVAHDAVVTVDGGLHAFQQRPGRAQRRNKLIAIRKPLPDPAHRPLAERKAFRPEQVLEKVQPGIQGVYRAGAGMQIVRIHPVAQVFNALAGSGQHFLARMQFKAQPLPTVKGYGVAPVQQGRRVRAEQQEVVHVADVPPDPERVLDKMIQPVEVKIGKVLTGRAPDGQAGVSGRTEQAFVRRYLPQQAAGALHGAVIFQRGLLKQGGGYIRGQFLTFRGAIPGHRERPASRALAWAGGWNGKSRARPVADTRHYRGGA